MDVYHILLCLIILIKFNLNLNLNFNLNFNVKKYYMPIIVKLKYLIKIYIKKNIPKIRNYIALYLPFIKMQKLDRRSDLFLSIVDDKLKTNQQLCSWKYACGILNLKSTLNTGTIYRTGCLLGMKNYIIFGSKQHYDKRSAVGLTYVDTFHVNIFTKTPDSYDPSIMDYIDEQLFVSYIRDNYYIPVIIEQNGRNIMDEDFAKWESSIEFPYKYLFLFGNETYGISTKIVNILVSNFNNTKILSIPQWGCAHSYNVSQAANIVMWEYFRANYAKRLLLHR